MTHKLHISFYFLVALFFSSCFKKEDPLILPTGNTEITTVFLGKNYEKELYFDLGTNTYQEKMASEWDIRFETTANGFGVFLNNGNNIIARKINISNLDESKASDTVYIKSCKELVDAPEGYVSGSAIGDWRNYKSLPPLSNPGIYVIELSYMSGLEKYKRLQILNYDDSAFYIRITSLGQINGDTLVIPKDKNRNYTYYSFKNGGNIVSNPEPDKHTWDIVFTRYKHIFYGILPGNEPFPYRVTGVLSSRNKVEVARDSTTGFENIDAGSIRQYTFSKDQNAIGYDWKSHAFGAAGNYTVNSKITYIIKDTDGNYFKLHFLDFYDANGDKGYPKFEFVRIK